MADKIQYMQWRMAQWGLWMVALLLAETARGEIYADFTTDQGTFTVQLETLRAPRATANFLGLAAGTQSWRDPQTGSVQGGPSGVAYYDGFQFYATEGTLALLGGLRPYSGAGGVEYWEGPGYTILDETTNGVDLVRGILAMAEFDGPHSGGGELALMLTNAPFLGSGWTGFGAVTGAGMAVVETILNEVTNGSGRVAAQIAIRDEAMTPDESAALTTARSELPSIEEMPLGFSRVSNATTRLSFETSPKSRACLSSISNLAAGSWSVLAGDWNTDTNEIWRDIALDSIPGMGSQMGFLVGSQAVYPKMTASLFPGKIRIGAAHTDMDMQYWLDFTGGTGMWARVSNSVPVESGAITWVGQELGTANSLHVVLFIGLTAYHYWLGFDDAGATQGRFYCELWPYNAWLEGTDSGTYEVADGWGSKKALPKTWKTTRVPAPKTVTQGRPFGVDRKTAPPPFPQDSIMGGEMDRKED